MPRVRKYSPREYDLLATMWEHWREGGKFEKAEPGGWSSVTPPEATDLMIAGWVYPTTDRSIRITKWW